jgi:S1-C subfamily serine protease
VNHRWPTHCSVAALLLVVAAPVAPQSSISLDTVDLIARASVFLRVDRVFKYDDFPSSGSGFFIHRDGYIVTNWHVVADQIEGHLWKRDREINAKVIGLTAVIDSGQPGERELPAKIVARDRERDLALLKVSYRPQAASTRSMTSDSANRSGAPVFPTATSWPWRSRSTSRTCPTPRCR